MMANGHKIDELCKLYTPQQIVVASGMVICRFAGANSARRRAFVLNEYLRQLESCLDEAGDKINNIITETNEILGIKP